jgi:sugar phosphate permease
VKDNTTTYTVYGYRWIVLLLVSIVTMIIEMQWLTFAPVARQARLAYGVSALQIDILSMIFMGVFLVVCIPASYVIDRYGIRIGIGVGALLTGIFGVLKAVFASSYPMMVVAQVGLGVAQPFILNAVTKVAVKWFPANERATAVGITTLAQFIGFIGVMVATPYLVPSTGGSAALGGMLTTYGIISAAGSALFLLLMREEPPTPPGEQDQQERLLSREGFRHILRQRDMRLTLGLFFIGLGVFNAITTCIDQICEVKGLTSERSGSIMGVMFAAGIVGAVVLPTLSDRVRKRKPFLLASSAVMIPGLAGLTRAESYDQMLISAASIGFFLLGGGAPIGFQYAAEISYPAPESLSQGLILLTGQISGILFVVAMNGLGMINSLYLFIVLAIINLVLTQMLGESPILQSRRSSNSSGPLPQ